MNCHPVRIFAILTIACLLISSIPVSADSGSPGTLTRGGRFTITITGKPITPYYFWLARTYSLSGKPGDQPPVVAGGQMNVEQDPSGGPYTIGSYAYSNGNGRTILDDVAPSTPEMPNTSYYGKVTTDADGRAVVLFRTSSATATRTFSVKAENPASPSDPNVLVEEGLFSRTTPVPSATVVTVIQETQTPTPSPATPRETTAPATTVLPVTQVPVTPRSDMMAGIGILALGAAVAIAARKA